MSEEIVRGIYTVGGPGLSAGGDAAIYLVDGSERAALIDAGTGEATGRIIRNIEKCGVETRKIELLVLTHCHVDHSGGVPDFQRELGLEVTAHKNCADILAIGDDRRTAAGWYGVSLPPIRIDRAFYEDELRLSLGDDELVCLFTPGHSPGSISIYLDRDGQRILFGQDVHGPIHPQLESDADLWQQSLERLIALKADVLCEGHFGVFRPAEAVESYIRSYLI